MGGRREKASKKRVAGKTGYTRVSRFGFRMIGSSQWTIPHRKCQSGLALLLRTGRKCCSVDTSPDTISHPEPRIARDTDGPNFDQTDWQQGTGQPITPSIRFSHLSAARHGSSLTA